MTDKEMIQKFLDKNYQVLVILGKYIIFNRANRLQEKPDDFLNNTSEMIFNYTTKDVIPYDIIFEWYTEKLVHSVLKFLEETKNDGRITGN